MKYRHTDWKSSSMELIDGYSPSFPEEQLP
jgi:hypothetical protein